MIHLTLLIFEKIIKLEKPSKNNNSDFKFSLFEANDIIEKKEKEGIKDIKEMIETLVDNI